MIFHQRAVRVFRYALAFSLLFSELPAFAQVSSSVPVASDAKVTGSLDRFGKAQSEPAGRPVVSPTMAHYFDPLQGTSSNDLVRRALASNGELNATRINIERARARLRQAGLRPNPTLDFEQTTGRFTGAAGETERSIGVALPIELGGKRRRRIELAQAELEASEAEVADRERTLAADVRVNYAEALAALRELEITENLNELDRQTTRFVQARVNEGESAPIELNLLLVEVDRLRSRRASGGTP